MRAGFGEASIVEHSQASSPFDGLGFGALLVGIISAATGLRFARVPSPFVRWGLIVATPLGAAWLVYWLLVWGFEWGSYDPQTGAWAVVVSILWGVPGVVVAAVATYLSRVWRLRTP
ncbi:MAG: hypothetical protein U0Q11_20050 [Vicinamibacterales bacterium]